ncbi:hypothetical protein F2P79_022361 [Pimephales promelas]|nr:hypothetical protein F2P79_022361 [Pimephales promelas]
MSLLRRSSSWRRPGERGYYEGPVAQVNEPRRRARPQSCIEGGRMDKWLQTLESRPLQKKTPQFADRTCSTPVLPNEMTGSSPLCPDLSSLGRRNQSSVCESLESKAMSNVHIKPAPGAERAEFCALAPVHFGWLPIQRHVILTDISNNSQDNSRCQQKLKSPITPVLLSTPDKRNGPRPNERESVRPEPAGFRYWRTPDKTSILHQASLSASSEGGRNGLQAWNPKASFTSKVETGQSPPHPDHPALKDPTCRRGSAPESLSSSISSITITSKKVTHTSSLPKSGHLSSMATNNPAAERRKALVVKVTEQRMKSTSSQNLALTPGCNHEEIDHGVVLRRKATIVKMTEQREHFNREKPNRHSYSEGLDTSESKVHPSPLNPVSLEPGRNQWRSQHRSSLSLYLNKHSTTEEETKPLRRPLSCDASWFNHTEHGANAVTDPAFHNKSSPVAQKTNIDLVSSSSSEARRRSTSRSLMKEGFEWDGAFEEPVSEMKPLTLLKVSENSPHLNADAVLALNAAAVIANIKLQAQHRQKDEQTQTTSHTKTAVSLPEDRGNNEEAAGADGKNKMPPASPCVAVVPVESQNVPTETALSLSVSYSVV